MSFSFVKNLQDIDLHKQRVKSFKIVVLCEVIMILMALLLPEMLKMFGVANYIIISELIFPLFVMFVMVLWWDMLRIYTKNKTLIITLFILMASVFLSNLILLNPIKPLLKGTVFDIYSIFLMLFIFSLSAISIKLTIIEIFRNNLPIDENLWGAVFIYLTTAIAFASIYTVLPIIDGAQIIIDVPQSPIFYQKMLAYSMIIMGGIDNPYPHLSELFINISALEAVLGNLFIVFVVGRLFVINVTPKDI